MDRLYLNLVMHDFRRSICSLYRMDLRHLFYKSAETAVQAAEVAKANNNHKPRALSMIASWNDLRHRVVNFKTSFNFFTLLRENSIMMGDSLGHTTLLDIDFKSIVTMPSMRNGKSSNCICFAIPNVDPFKILDTQCLFVLDLVPGSSTESSTFEYLTYLGSNQSSQPLVSSHYDLNWLWRDLRLPPFADNLAHSPATEMHSSMLLDGSSLCVSSSEEGIGSYIFDTVDHEWSQAGTWVLPFSGKAEYVPQLKLWFALSASSTHSLCALDLPAMDFKSPPNLLRSWDYLDLHETPYQRQLVNLGSGKFCIVSFFKTLKSPCVEEIIEDESAVFTAVEICRSNSTEGPVRMIKHMSKRYKFGSYGIRCVL